MSDRVYTCAQAGCNYHFVWKDGALSTADVKTHHGQVMKSHPAGECILLTDGRIIEHPVWVETQGTWENHPYEQGAFTQGDITCYAYRAQSDPTGELWVQDRDITVGLIREIKWNEAATTFTNRFCCPGCGTMQPVTRRRIVRLAEGEVTVCYTCERKRSHDELLAIMAYQQEPSEGHKGGQATERQIATHLVAHRKSLTEVHQSDVDKLTAAQAALLLGQYLDNHSGDPAVSKLDRKVLTLIQCWLIAQTVAPTTPAPDVYPYGFIQAFARNQKNLEEWEGLDAQAVKNDHFLGDRVQGRVDFLWRFNDDDTQAPALAFQEVAAQAGACDAMYKLVYIDLSILALWERETRHRS
jgi:hypothetical protein